MMSLNLKAAKLNVFLITALVSLWANTASAKCSKIDPPFKDYLIYSNLGSSLYIDSSTPVGGIIAQDVINGDLLSSVNNGWVGLCDNNSVISYWWLEQHNSESSSRRPINGITAPTADGYMYVMKDNGKGNPYGGNGSGSIGYTVELLSNGSSLPFSEVGGSPPINVPPLTKGSIAGIPCDVAKSGSSGYPAFTGNCKAPQTVFNWRQLGSFSIRVTLYRLGGNIPVSGLTLLGNDGDRSFSLMSLMDNTSTPPSTNKNMFNLTRIALSNPIELHTSPCQAFTYPTVRLNTVSKNAFATVGKPGTGIANTPVNVSARCNANTAIKWAIMGKSDKYNSNGSKGILALDTTKNMAGGVGIQLVDKSGRNLPITPVNSVNYQWIDTNLSTNSSGQLLIQFMARYVRVGEVTPGVANSHAYLVISPK